MASTRRADALSATTSGMRDFEDALQMAAAVACGADVILTRNLTDFKSSPIAAIDSGNISPQSRIIAVRKV